MYMVAACTKFILNPDDQPVLDTLRRQNAQFNPAQSTYLTIEGEDSDAEDADPEHDKNELEGGTGKDLAVNLLGKLEYLFEYASMWDKFMLSIGLFFTIVHAASFPILAILFGKISNAYIIHTLEERQNSSTGPDAGSKDNIGLAGGLALSFLSKVTTSVGAGVNASAIPALTAGDGGGYFGKLNLYNDRAETNEDFANLVSEFSIYYVYIGLAVFVATFIQTFTWESVAENQLYRIRQKYIFQLQRQQLAWFNARDTGSLVLKMSDDCERFRDGVGQKLSLVIEYVAIACFGAGIGFLTNTKMTFVFLASTPFILSKMIMMWTKIANKSTAAQKGYGKAGKIFSEVLTGIPTVAANSAELNELTRYKTALAKGSKAAEGVEILTGLGIGGMYLLIYAFYAVALWYSVNLLAEGVITPGDIYTVFFGLTICAFAVGSLLPYLNCIAESFASKQLLSTVLNSVPEIDPYSMSGLRPRDFTGRIRFSNVTFSYPGREQTPVFKDLDFEFYGRGTIGIVGGASCGKATLVKLMQRFYDVQSGQVLFDTNDITTLNVRWVREQVSVVNKKAVLLQDTIFENIRSFRKEVTLHRVVRAAKKALVHDYIKSLPKGYFTYIDKNLSLDMWEGYRIKIHIARNILLNPKVLILHKVLPVLGMIQAKEICTTLAELRKTALTIIVDNQLAVVREADFIFVFKDGTVVEKGTDQQLIEQKGIYYRVLLHEKPIVERPADRVTFSTFTLAGMTKSEESKSLTTNLGRLFRAMPNKLTLYLGFTGCLLSSLVVPLLALCLGQILHMFVGSKRNLYSMGIYWVEMLTGLAILAGIGYCSRTVFIGLTGERLSMLVRLATFKSVLRQQISWFDCEGNGPARVHARLATGIPFIRNAIGPRLGVALSATITMIVGLTVSAYYSWRMALTASMLIPLMVGAYYSLKKVVNTDYANSTRLRGILIAQTTGIIRDVEAIQSASKASVICSRTEKIIYPALVQGHKRAAGYALVFGATECFMFFIFGLTFHFGAELIREGSLTISSLFTVFFVLTFGSLSLGQATNFIPEWLKARLSSKYIVEMIDQRSTLDPFDPAGLRPIIQGEIVFRDVWFDYESKPSVLKGVNIKIPPASLVAIVGPPGAGKSTLLLILERFYNISIGEVLIDGVNIHDINPVYLRQHIGFVPQEPILFNISVRENIAYGYHGPERGDELVKLVEKAANFANAKFITEDLPNQFETRCGEGGRNLSVAQRQSIALARAAMKNPPIYLFDEPTQTLNAAEEKSVHSAMYQIIQKRTTLVVTNMYATIKQCHLVAFLDNGKVKEFGKPLELLATKGCLYAFLEGQGVKVEGETTGTT